MLEGQVSNECTASLLVCEGSMTNREVDASEMQSGRHGTASSSAVKKTPYVRVRMVPIACGASHSSYIFPSNGKCVLRAASSSLSCPMGFFQHPFPIVSSSIHSLLFLPAFIPYRFCQHPFPIVLSTYCRSC